MYKNIVFYFLIPLNVLRYINDDENVHVLRIYLAPHVELNRCKNISFSSKSTWKMYNICCVYMYQILRPKIHI